MHTLTLTELSAQLKNKQISATELAQFYLDRIAKSVLNAYASVNTDLTLAQAKEADERIARGDRKSTRLNSSHT